MTGDHTEQLRTVINARKQAGLQVDDRKALAQFKNEIMRETLAVAMVNEPSEAMSAYTVKAEGNEMKIFLVRAGNTKESMNGTKR